MRLYTIGLIMVLLGLLLPAVGVAIPSSTISSSPAQVGYVDSSGAIHLNVGATSGFHIAAFKVGANGVLYSVSDLQPLTTVPHVLPYTFANLTITNGTFDPSTKNIRLEFIWRGASYGSDVYTHVWIGNPDYMYIPIGPLPVGDYTGSNAVTANLTYGNYDNGASFWITEGTTFVTRNALVVVLWNFDEGTVPNPVPNPSQPVTIPTEPPPVQLPASSYQLVINSSAGGTTSPDVGTYTEAANSQVTITATPANGWWFDHWFYGDDSTTLMNPLTLTMTQDYNIAPVFIQQTTTTPTPAPTPTPTPTPPSTTSAPNYLNTLTLLGIAVTLVGLWKKNIKVG
jgi:hypothetical protein